MGKYICETSTFMVQFATSLKGMNPNIKLRVGFVGYRDHCDGKHRIECLHFTENLGDFCEFIANVKDKGVLNLLSW